ncbi:hypothetical protein VT85_03910 [Planctomyces sp. SH-PL62]|nr:hypothetical protein VT85_03910 [Planctomyces sp. SH-PL62]
MNLGTIISSASEETLILTCPHNLGPDGEPRKITVIYPDPTGADLSQDRPSRDLDVAVSGELVARDDDRDLAVLRIKPGRPLPGVRLAPPGRRLQEGQELLRTERTEDETTTLRYTTVIQSNATLLNSGKKDYLATCCLGLPMPGDSGSPLLLRSDDPGRPSWELVGVFNASVPQESKGYYASPEAIHAFLDANGLTALIPGAAPGPDHVPAVAAPIVAAPAVESPPTPAPAPPEKSASAPAPLPNEPASPLVHIGVEGTPAAEGFGVIVRSTADESIVLTAGSLFDTEEGAPRVEPKAFSRKVSVTLAASPNAVYTVPAPAEFTLPGEVVDYDLARNVGLIRIRPGRLLPAATVVPRGWPVIKGRSLTVYKLGDDGHIAAKDVRIVDPDVRGEVDGVIYAAIECERSPKRDELGMPLELGLVVEGEPRFMIIGVCNYSESSGPGKGTGLYASPEMIHHILETNGYATTGPEPKTPEPLAPARPFRRLPKPDAAPTTPRPDTAVGEAPRLDRVERRVDDMGRKLDRILEALEKPRTPPR